MQKSSFFNSIEGDRRYKAEEFAAYFASFIGNGVFPNPSNNLKVQCSDGMKIIVQAGKAWINGYFYTNTTDQIIELSTADGVLKRIDRVVVRWSLSDRDMYIAVKNGVLSSNPTPPAVQRDGDCYELALADIAISKGAVEIKQTDITDQRYNLEVCGYVAHVVQQLDLTDFYEECSRNMMQQVETWENQTTGQRLEYEEWKKTIDSWRDLNVTELSKVLSFSFDNQFAHVGTIMETTQMENGSIVSVIKYKNLDNVLAEKTTSVKEDGTIEIFQKVYNTDQSIFSNAKKIVKMVDNKVITEVVSV